MGGRGGSEPEPRRGTGTGFGSVVEAGPGSAAGSVLTVVVAAAANLGVALAKAVVGIIGGSSAMLAEAVHSAADTVTELMLLTALKRGAKPADEDHPLGYGPARYIWALLASVATFVGGGVFALYDGVHALIHERSPGDPLYSYLVLAIAFVLEGLSPCARGLKQATGRARRFRMPVLHYLRRTPDTAVKAVVLEDTAALIGLALAALGLLGSRLTGSGAWDGVASILIGVLLVVVAWVLGRSNAELLIGRALPRPVRDAVRGELMAVQHIDDVLELVDFRDVSTSDQIEWACEDAETRLRALLPAIRRVYLDPTPRRRGG
ncbi:cation diffusion facilitator family transporter [Streptomyces sp. NPDC090073]|uniref:cation diffusion facilitator family transporter n=1 Tax=Streptomyces sp. NPDC090073 TaxID=3365936 RepID=UPI0038277E34